MISDEYIESLLALAKGNLLRLAKNKKIDILGEIRDLKKAVL